MKSPQQWYALRQFFRYVLVGLGLNSSLYLMFVIFTRYGIHYQVSMTICYVMGILLGHALHGRISFSARRNHQTFLRYIIAYAFGYFVNFLGLLLLVELLALSKYLSQALMIFVVAVMLFLMQRAWVFSTSRASEP
jgi:putative flippase GtrA